MSDLTTAKTIHAQLGGQRFAVMTGAKNFVGGENWLSFRFPAANGVNYMKITLNEWDTYNIEAGKIHGHSYKVKHELSGIYAEQLQPTFTDLTGLYTAL